MCSVPQVPSGISTGPESPQRMTRKETKETIDVSSGLLDLLRRLADPRVGAQWRIATPSRT